MKLKPILWTYHKTKSKTYPIKIRITTTINKKTTPDYLPLDVSVKIDQWDKKACRVKKHANADVINLKIVETLTTLEKNYISDGTTDGKVSDADKTDFYYWFDERLKYCKAEFGTYNYDKLVTVKNKLQTYAPNLKISQVTYKFLRDYKVHLLENGHNGKKNSHNTVEDNLMRIKTVIKEIMKAGNLPYHKNPFNDIKITMKKPKRERLALNEIQSLNSVNTKPIKFPTRLKRELTEEELNRREAIDWEKHPSVELAMLIYMFSFNSGGIRWGDMCRLKWEMISDGRLKFIMHKTTIERNIKLRPIHYKILERYRPKPNYNNTSPYIFPIGVKWAPNNSDDKDEIRKEDKSINSRNVFFNKKLEVACGWAKIPKVTMHTSRHSLADISVKKKIDTRALKDIFGHGKISTTEAYLKSFYSEEADEAMDTIFEDQNVLSNAG